MRMFAGPNGSGKSVLKSYLPHELLGVYLNADEIELEVKRIKVLDLSKFCVSTSKEEILSFFQNSDLLRSRNLGDVSTRIIFANGSLDFSAVTFNAYIASVVVDFLRKKLLESRRTFTFETVMSHPSKVEILESAQHLGYRTYLYYVATDDPSINISRVKNRVKLNGHDVPHDLIEKRYYGSLALLRDAISRTNRAYIFDNSTDNAEKQHTWLAEVTEGTLLEIKTDRIPIWFKRAVLDKIS